MFQDTKKYPASAFFSAENDLSADSNQAPPEKTDSRPDDKNQAAFSFLHDLLNSAGGLSGFLEMMAETDDSEKLKKYASNALFLCGSMVEEINSYQDFLRAETGTFRLAAEETKVSDILESTALKLKEHDVSKGRTIEVADFPEVSVLTDKVLLSRVLVNLVKNAVENTEQGGSVRIGAVKISKAGDNIRFWVRNDGFIPEEIQSRIFSGPFSSKGVNRGIGLSGIRMIGENALGGHVHFKSTKEGGTCFCIDLPTRE
jgi:signal transduction histidine kinase